MSGIRVPDTHDEVGTADDQPATQSRSGHRNPLLRFLKILGPGVVTGAADDDPSELPHIRKPAPPTETACSGQFR